MRHQLRAGVAVLLGAAVIAGCGGGGNGNGDEPANGGNGDAPKANGGGTAVDLERGRQLFRASCGTCHALADAETNGTFGTDLDQVQPDRETVLRQIQQGGGGMPANLLEGEEAEVVSDYVAEVAGSPGAGGGGE